jgi:NAD(P)-dependent dehydrogenase (short-subunit alcohol dehydrogenase family)
MDNIFNLRNKVALVTGASKGLGKNICLSLSEAGANIIAVSRSKAALDEVGKEINRHGGEALSISADISNSRDVKDMVDRSINEFGRIDILVNNAGISGPIKLFRDYDESEWMNIFDVNLKGTMLCTKYVGQTMIEKKGGKIVNISSVLGSIGTYFTSVYSVTKAGIIQFTRNIALEWAKYNILANCISPGMLETEMMKDTLNNTKALSVILKNTPLRRIGKTEDVVGAVVFLASDASSHITGENISIDGGFSMSKS